MADGSGRRCRGSRGARAAGWLAALIAAQLAPPAAALELHPGDLIVTDTRRKALVRIDARTLAREDVTSPDRGGGDVFQFPSDLALDGAGGILVTDLNRQRIYRVDPASGDRRPLGTARVAGSLRTLARSPDGRFVVGLGGRAARLVWFDPATGAIPPLSGPERGKGPAFNRPVAVDFPASGGLLVADRVLGVLRVDAATGDRLPLPSPSAAPGGDALEPYDLALAGDGAAWVVDHAIAAVVRVDPGSGARSTLSGAGAGDGPPFAEPYALALESDGRIAVVDRRRRSVFRVDPDTGARSVIASDEVGDGPGLRTPRRIAVVPGAPAPPPSAAPAPGGRAGPRVPAILALVALAAAVGATLAVARRRRRATP